MMVRALPDGDPQERDPGSLPYLADHSNGRDSLSASANNARPDAPATDTHTVAASGGQPRPDEDELIREYIAKAGPVGPRKIFSASRFDATFGVGALYDDNILLSSTGPRRSDVITTVVGGIRLSLGDFADRVNTYVIVSYAGTGSLFARNGGEDSYDQDAVLDVLYRLHRTTFASTSVFQERHDATADFGERVGRYVYGEDFTIKYQRNDYTTLSAGLHFEHDDDDWRIDTTNFMVNAALDYALSSKVTVGAGAVFGRLTSTGDLEEYSEEAQLRLGYAVTHKITAAAAVGIEYRERGGNASDSLTPVFVLTTKWTPFNNTTLDLEAHRRTEASGSLEGADFVDTGFQLGVRQNFLQRFYARLDAGFQNASYKNVASSESIPRTDNYFSIRGTAGYDFVRWFQVLAFYEHREDQSTRENFSFVSNRVGMEVNLNY